MRPDLQRQPSGQAQYDGAHGCKNEYCGIVRKHACLRSSFGPMCVLMVSENGMGVPAIIGDAIGGRVRIRWRVPIRIDSDLDLVLLRARPL